MFAEKVAYDLVETALADALGIAVGLVRQYRSTSAGRAKLVLMQTQRRNADLPNLDTGSRQQARRAERKAAKAFATRRAERARHTAKLTRHTERAQRHAAAAEERKASLATDEGKARAEAVKAGRESAKATARTRWFERQERPGRADARRIEGALLRWGR